VLVVLVRLVAQVLCKGPYIDGPPHPLPQGVIWGHHACLSTRSTDADRGRRRCRVRQWLRSGRAAAEFAEAVGVSVRRLARWRREVGSPQRLTVPRAAFVELVSMPAARATVGSISAFDGADCVPAAPISLRPRNGLELRLPPGFDADFLRRAVEVLQPLVAVGSGRIGDAVAAESSR